MNDILFFEEIAKALSDKGLYYVNIPLDYERFKVVLEFVDNKDEFSEDFLCEISPIDLKRAFYWVRSKVCMMRGCCSCNVKPLEWVLIYFVATMRVLYKAVYDPKEDSDLIDSDTINILESYGLNNTKF